VADVEEVGGGDGGNLNWGFIPPLLFLFDSVVVTLPTVLALSSCTRCKPWSSLPSSNVGSKRDCGGLPADEGWLMKADEMPGVEFPRAGAGIDALYDAGELLGEVLVGGLVGGKGKDA
jgi:hypothetical protein